MICVVIPTYNAAAVLPALLTQLRGKVDRAVVSDSGSTDSTIEITASHAVIAAGAKGRGQQLALGAYWAGEADWLLFLHADNVLPEMWRTSVERHITHHPTSVGYFHFRANANGLWPRFMDFWVATRCKWWGLPYGDQGLLISREMYQAVGGYPQQALFEDVAIIDAIKAKYGRTALRPLEGYMSIDVSKYERDGFWTRGFRNLRHLKAYRRGEPIEALAMGYK